LKNQKFIKNFLINSILMDRINTLDNLRGIAFLFMMVHHIFYYIDISNNNLTNYADSNIVNTCGVIARTSFIFLAGYSMNMTYKKYKEKYLMKRFIKSFEIFVHALIITIVSYVLYNDNYIRFGILHFISLGTLIISILTPYKKLSLVALLLSITIKLPIISPTIDTITGASADYNMLDWYPLNKWLPLLLSGMIAGQYIKFNHIKFNHIKILQESNILTSIGKNCLNLYTIHIVIFMIMAKLKKSTF